MTRDQLQKDLAHIAQMVTLAREVALDDGEDGIDDDRAFEFVRDALMQCGQALIRVRKVR